ncbi:hypothetical protein, partial [Frankia sp. CIT1]
HTVIFGHADAATGGVRWGDELLTPVQFADRIRGFLPGDGQPIVLVVCGAGAGFAAGLRDVLGVDVVASSQDVWHLPDGRVISAATGVSVTGVPGPVVGSGGWSRFTADGGRVDVTVDDLAVALAAAGIPMGGLVAGQSSMALRWGADTTFSEMLHHLPVVQEPVYAILPSMSEDAVTHWLQAASDHPLTVSNTLPQTYADMTVVQFPPGTGRDASTVLNVDSAAVTVAVVDPSTEIDLMVEDWPEPGSTFVTLRHDSSDPPDSAPVVGSPGGGRKTSATGATNASRPATGASSPWGWSSSGMSTVSELLRRVGAVRAAELLEAVERFVESGSGRALLTPNDLLALVVRGHNGIHRTTAYEKDLPELKVRTYHGWMYTANLFTPEMATSLRPGTRVGLPGFAQASSDPATIVGAAVGLAIFGTALDLSEMNGQPPGTILLIMPGHSYAVIEVGHDALNAVRITLME